MLARGILEKARITFVRATKHRKDSEEALSNKREISNKNLEKEVGVINRNEGKAWMNLAKAVRKKPSDNKKRNNGKIRKQQREKGGRGKQSDF